MYPDYPYSGFTWQISQHIAVVKEDYVLGLLRACSHLDGESVDIPDIDAKIAEQGMITSESGRSIWRDYQQVLCEFGFMYATDVVDNRVRLTPIARELLAGKMTFSEVLAFQLLKYQYPNAYKNTIPSALKAMLPAEVSECRSLTLLQEHFDIKIRPLPFLWLILEKLSERLKYEIELSTEEIATYVFRCSDHNDIEKCVDTILKHKSNEEHLPLPTGNLKRNASDWFALMSMTRFFTRSKNGIKRSNISIAAAEALTPIFESLCDQSNFWIMTDDDGLSWYDSFGSLDCPLKNLILQDGKRLWRFFPNMITNNVLANSQII